MVFLFLGAIFFSTFIAYRHFEQKEFEFTKGFSNFYGPFKESFNLNFLKVAGKECLGWGSKLYIFERGMVIGNPLKEEENIPILTEDIKNCSFMGNHIVFFHKYKEFALPIPFELSAGPFQKKLPYFFEAREAGRNQEGGIK